jgi:hypothetical protein
MVSPSALAVLRLITSLSSMGGSVLPVRTQPPRGVAGGKSVLDRCLWKREIGIHQFGLNAVH